MSVLTITDATFEQEVLRSELPVLVDLYADWCQPCKQIAPIVEEVATELSGKLKVCKVDVDKNPLISQTFRVQSIPMLVLFAEGKVAGHQLGMVDKPTLLKMVQPVLPADAAELKPEDLARLLHSQKAVPVDIREPGAFARYRIPGAQNLPAEGILAHAVELKPSDGRVRVLYGRTSEDAKALADEIRQKGVDVAYLAGGFLHWEADGFEVERG